MNLEMKVCPKCKQHTPMSHIAVMYDDSDGTRYCVRYFRCMGCLGLFKEFKKELEEVTEIGNVQFIDDRKCTKGNY